MQKIQAVLDTRLDFLLKDGDWVEAERWRQEYAAERTRLREKREGAEQILHRLSAQKQSLEQDSFDWKMMGGSARKVMEVIAEHDPVALKNAYKQLFEAIVVGDLDKEGKRSLEFFIRDGGESVSFVIPGETSSSISKMG